MDRSILIYAVFLVLVISFPFGNAIAHYGEPDLAGARNIEHQMALANSYTPHGPIIISSNADFSSQGWPGSGNSTDPYVIEGLEITADAVCISVTGTTVYFEVRNCVISAGGLSSYDGIVLDGVTHGTVQNCTIDLHRFGILLTFSSSCTLTNNTSYSNSLSGFYLSNSDNCTLTHNTAYSNSDDGFYLYLSGSSTLTDNTASSNDYGFHIYQSNSSTLTDNTASSNSDDGFYLYQSNSSTLTDNIASRSWVGFALWYSSSCTLTNNTATSNYHGFALRYSSSCTLTNNTASSSSWHGFDLRYSSSCTLTGNTASGDYICGLYLVNSDNCTLMYNTITNNDVGFYLSNSTRCTLMYNIASNKDQGFDLDNCVNCTLTHNTASNNDYWFSGTNNEQGFDLDYCVNCTLTHNTASNKYRGFSLYYAVNCTLTYNIAINNPGYGITLTICSYNILYYNRLGNNSISNAGDDGGSNIWDDGVSSGNYWADYNGTGTYLISGTSGSVDNYPLIWDIIAPTVDSPSDVEYMEGESGNSITWSPSDDHPESFTIYQNGTVIASGPWDGSPITVEVDGLSPGVYNYTLVVTDVGGNTVTDTVLIAVRDVGGTILILVLFGAGIAVVMIVVVIILRKRKT